MVPLRWKLSRTCLWCLHFVAAAELIASTRLPLTTKGRHIVDSKGRTALLQCVNWYGAHMEMLVMNGLNHQPLSSIAAGIPGLGFNCVRLPYALDMIYGNISKVPDAAVSLKANPALQDLSPLEVFDATVAALTGAGLLVVLNSHLSTAKWCCSLSDGEGLWFTERYPEVLWFEHLSFLTKRYRHNALVAGFDLRNELRESVLGRPTWGYGSHVLDWSVAAEHGAKLVLQENHNMLVFVSGLEFANFLCDAPKNFIHLHDDLHGHIVYTSHEYSWSHINRAAREQVAPHLTSLALLNAFLWMFAAASFLLEYCGILTVNWSCYPCPSSKRSGISCSPSRTKTLLGVCPFFGFPFLPTLASIIAFQTARVHRLQCSSEGLEFAVLVESFGHAALAIGVFLWLRVAGLCLWRQCSSTTQPQVAPTVELAARDVSMVEVSASLDVPSAAAIGCTRLDEPLSPTRRSSLQPGGQQPSWRAACARVLISKRVCVAALAAVTWLVFVYLHWYYGQYATFAAELDARWGFLLNGTEGVPIWLGEFGTEDDSIWWQHVLRYVRERELGFAYWSLNGEKRPGQDEAFGILKPDMAQVRHAWKLQDLQELMQHQAAQVAQ